MMASPPPADQLSARDSVYIQGVIDLLIVTADRAVVLDFKTDRGADAATLTKRYAGQLGWYCRAAQQLLPSHRINWSVYGLDREVLVGPAPYAASK